MRRFHLLSFCASVLVAAVLLGANVSPRIIAASSGSDMELPSCWSPNYTIKIPETNIHSRVVLVQQGWPLAYRKEDAFVSVATPIPDDEHSWEYTPALSRWSWNAGTPRNVRDGAINAVILLIATALTLFGMELILRRVATHSPQTAAR